MKVHLCLLTVIASAITPVYAQTNITVSPSDFVQPEKPNAYLFELKNGSEVIKTSTFLTYGNEPIQLKDVNRKHVVLGLSEKNEPIIKQLDLGYELLLYKVKANESIINLSFSYSGYPLESSTSIIEPSDASYQTYSFNSTIKLIDGDSFCNEISGFKNKSFCLTKLDKY
ncbi:hypothetical protein ACN256_003000 [Vibrio cholerae]|uniref:hypothetical protein n=1 Tax=Vibrio cholerae TaxID=666 RepID=UPI001E56122D|nr:hypothetical protein [Vibrio cholerae]MCD1171155.1 hypothetical protein [Vibrio cholerae]HDL9461381.1 hypothetical protein [Vibrio cholerae]